MAARYWVGGTGTWDATTTHWSATSGGSGGASVPTAADDVFFDANTGTATVTIGVSAFCRSLTTTGSTITWASGGAFNLNIGDASGGALTLSANDSNFNSLNGMVFASTSTNGGAGWPITTAGKNMPNVIFGGSNGKWQLQDSWTSALDINLTSGGLDTNNQSVTIRSFVSSNTNTRSLTLGSSTITCTGGSAWNMTTTTGLTFSAGTSTIILTGTNPTLIGSVTFYTVQFVGPGNALGSGSTTYTNLTRIGTANKTDTFLPSFCTVTGTLTITGNSPTNRVLVASSAGIIGAQRQINCTGTIVASNVDFQDIQGGGSANWDLSGISGGAGDAGGNAGITFTTAATQTHTASAGGNWSDVTKWTSRVPLPQDDVVVNSSTTGTLTIDMPRVGANIDFSGFGGVLSVGTGTSSYGSLLLASSMSMTTTNGWKLTGRANHTFTTNGVIAWGNWTFTGPGSTYSLVGALTSQFGTIQFTTGTVNMNGNTVTALTVQFFGATVNAASSTFNLTGVTAALVVWQFNSGTFSGTGSSIIIATATTNSRTFTGGNQTYGNLTYTIADSPGILVITGTNTFANLNVGPGRILTFPSSSTTTVTNLNVTTASNGYQYLPAILGNYVSTPDSPPLKLVGDIDVQAYINPKTWTVSGDYQAIVCKRTFASNSAEFGFRIFASSNKLSLYWYESGTAKEFISSVGVPFSDGTAGWVRATRSNTGGPGGVSQVIFYTSTDGTTWTQLGTVQNGAVAASPTTTTNEVAIGAIGSNVTSQLFQGAIYRVIVKNGIAGTTQLDANFATKTFGANTFTESSATAASMTINGLSAQVGDGRVAINASTSGTAATLSKATGTVKADYLILQDSAATGGATWFAGSHSANISNNSGWIFGDQGGSFLQLF